MYTMHTVFHLSLYFFLNFILLSIYGVSPVYDWWFLGDFFFSACRSEWIHVALQQSITIHLSLKSFKISGRSSVNIVAVYGLLVRSGVYWRLKKNKTKHKWANKVIQRILLVAQQNYALYLSIDYFYYIVKVLLLKETNMYKRLFFFY